MSWQDHEPIDEDDGNVRCIWCGEPWHCPTVKLVAEVIKDVATSIKPLGSEPRGSVGNVDTEHARWETRNDIAEEIEDMIPEGLR